MANEMFTIIVELIQLVIKVIRVYLLIAWQAIGGRARKSVSGRVVLLTGAGHGLGREIALQLSQLGAKLALVDVNKVSD